MPYPRDQQDTLNLRSPSVLRQPESESISRGNLAGGGTLVGCDVRKRFASGGVWSLWDMLPFQVHELLSAFSALDSIKNVMSREPEKVLLNVNMLRWFRENVGVVARQSTLLNLTLSLNKCKYIYALADNSRDDFSCRSAAPLIISSLDELRSRVNEELESRKVYVIKTEMVSYIDNVTAPFGMEVLDKFQDVSADSSEAAYCLAMSRNTACVFHLMRVLERAVFSLGQKLNVTVIDKNNKELEWGKILANLNHKIEGMEKGDEKNEWSSVSALLFHVKNAWRNSTMHPNQTYTDDDAKTIFEATRSFVAKLAKMI